MVEPFTTTMSSLPSLSQSIKPTPPLIDSTMYCLSGVEMCGTVRPTSFETSLKRGSCAHSAGDRRIRTRILRITMECIHYRERTRRVTKSQLIPGKMDTHSLWDFPVPLCVLCGYCFSVFAQVAACVLNDSRISFFCRHRGLQIGGHCENVSSWCVSVPALFKFRHLHAVPFRR